MRAIQARLLALFAAIVLLLPGTASARAQYYCRIMGCVVGSASCDNGAASKAAGPTQELRRADCCVRISSPSRSTALGTLDAGKSVPPATLAATLPEHFAPNQSGEPIGVCAESTKAPLALGPPLFIVHCAFLS